MMLGRRSSTGPGDNNWHESRWLGGWVMIWGSGYGSGDQNECRSG